MSALTRWRKFAADNQIPPGYLPDGVALDLMAEVMSGVEWSADTLEELADILRRTNRVVAEPDERAAAAELQLATEETAEAVRRLVRAQEMVARFADEARAAEGRIEALRFGLERHMTTEEER